MDGFLSEAKKHRGVMKKIFCRPLAARKEVFLDRFPLDVQGSFHLVDLAEACLFFNTNSQDVRKMLLFVTCDNLRA